MAQSMKSSSSTDVDLSTNSAPVEGTVYYGARVTEPAEDIEKAIQEKHAPTGRPQTTLAPDDVENPRNWSVGKKLLIDATLCIWVLSLTYSSTAYVASVPALMREFDISRTVALLGVTLTVVGFAAGPLLFGPASELYGRRIIYIVSGLAYTAFTIGTAFAPNAASLLVMRFLTGFFGSSSINNVPASIGDFTTPQNRGPYQIPYPLMAFGGPSLGPLCSSFIETQAGYRWNLRVIAIFSSVMSILVAFVPETHGPTLYKAKLKREGKKVEKVERKVVIQVMKTAMARPIIYLFTEPIVTLVSLYLSVLYCILYGFFASFTYVFIDLRGFTVEHYGLTYVSLGLGFFVGCILLGTVGNRSYLRQAAKAKEAGQRTPPEARLSLAYFGAAVAPISLFLFAWTAPFPHIHWIVPLIGEFLFGLSMLVIFTSYVPYLIENYLETAASALAAGMASRALLGSVFPLFALQMNVNLTVQGATSLLAGLTLMLAPIPFIFSKYGPGLREKSRYAVVL